MDTRIVAIRKAGNFIGEAMREAEELFPTAAERNMYILDLAVAIIASAVWAKLPATQYEKALEAIPDKARKLLNAMNREHSKMQEEGKL